MVHSGTNDFHRANIKEHALYPNEKIKVEPPSIFDHKLLKDMMRRDAACNSLYYDAQNEVIVDPSGHGVMDAENGVARIEGSREDHQDNRSILFRFLKLIEKGAIPDKKSWDMAREVFKDQMSHMTPLQRAHIIYQVWGKKEGVTAKDALEKCIKACKAGGCYGLFREFFKNDAFTLPILAEKIKSYQDAKEEVRARVKKVVTHA
jgi:hypothetical protein